MRQEIVDLGLRLVNSKLVAGSWGNISCRDEEGMIAITPSGRKYEQLQPEEVAIVDLSGMQLEGELVPSSELPLHLAIYHAYPQAKAVIHTHSIYASALACMHQDLPPIIEDLAQMLGGSVECAAYALPGTRELANNVVAALNFKQAALIANHGLVCWGQGLEEALMLCEIVEKAAQIYCIAAPMGGAKALSKEDVQVMHDFYVHHYAKRQNGQAED